MKRTVNNLRPVKHSANKHVILGKFPKGNKKRAEYLKSLAQYSGYLRNIEDDINRLELSVVAKKLHRDVILSEEFEAETSEDLSKKIEVAQTNAVLLLRMRSLMKFQEIGKELGIPTGKALSLYRSAVKRMGISIE